MRFIWHVRQGQGHDGVKVQAFVRYVLYQYVDADLILKTED